MGLGLKFVAGIFVPKTLWRSRAYQNPVCQVVFFQRGRGTTCSYTPENGQMSPKKGLFQSGIHLLTIDFSGDIR